MEFQESDQLTGTMRISKRSRRSYVDHSLPFIMTRIRGSYKKNYKPMTSAEMELKRFNVCQILTKKDYEQQSLAESQSLSKIVRSAKYQIQHGFETLDMNLDFKSSIDIRFRAAFYSIHDFFIEKPTRCCLLNPSRNMAWEGECFICNDFFCFAVIYPEIDRFYTPLKVSIPYVDIIAITKAGRKYHHDHINGKRPGKHYSPLTVIPVHGFYVKPTVIQIWTYENEVHQFYGFSSHFDNVFEHLCEHWNAHRLLDDEQTEY